MKRKSYVTTQEEVNAFVKAGTWVFFIDRSTGKTLVVSKARRTVHQLSPTLVDRLRVNGAMQTGRGLDWPLVEVKIDASKLAGITPTSRKLGADWPAVRDVRFVSGGSAGKIHAGSVSRFRYRRRTPVGSHQ